jgi:hypothetical protein
MDDLIIIKKRARVDSVESDLDSPGVKRLREDLLNNFEDDPDVSFPILYDLDSVMKSFEEEITPVPVVVNLTSDSGDSKPDLGYLLEASDDELGLPPVGKVGDEKITELIRVDSDDSSGNGGFWGFEDLIPATKYDSFELGVGENSYDEFDDSLFEYNDFFSDVSWR